jgi:hypothetical protein
MFSHPLVGDSGLVRYDVAWLKGTLRQVDGTYRLHLHYYHYFVWFCVGYGFIVHEVTHSDAPQSVVLLLYE